MATLKGGTLAQLAGDNGTTLQALQGLNPNLNANTTYTVGEVKLPGAQVDTSIPNPATVTAGLQKVPTQGVGPDGKPIYDVFAGGQHIADPSDPRLQGQNISALPTGTAPQGFKSKFEQGHADAQGAGITAPITSGQGAATVKAYTPDTQQNPITPVIQSDPYIQQLMADRQEMMDTANQRTSLTETYKQMLKDTGIQEIDTELLDMKNVIDGSEDDLRTEITKAGGFATDSQVMALTNARNKQLVKNYNHLLDTRNSKEKYLTTMIGLESEDRKAADLQFNKLFDIDAQIADYAQKQQKYAVESLDRTVKAIGWDGVYEATQGDPFLMSLVEKTYGLPQGGLGLAAQEAYNERAQKEEDRLLNVQSKQLDIEESQAGIDLKKEQLLSAPLDRELKKSQLLTEEYQRKNIISQINERNSKNVVNISDGNVSAIVAVTPALQGLSLEQQNGAVLTALLKNQGIGQGTRTKIADVLGVLTATESLSTSRQTSGFKGVSPLNNLLDVKIPFTNIGLPFRTAGKSKESIENAGYIDAINLKVQQWASGSSLTSEQIKQVSRFTPKMTDTDSAVRTKLNNLNNFMLEQAKSQLQSEGITFVPNKVNLFEAYDLLQQASPEQKQLLREQGLIQ